MKAVSWTLGVLSKQQSKAELCHMLVPLWLWQVGTQKKFLLLNSKQQWEKERVGRRKREGEREGESIGVAVHDLAACPLEKDGFSQKQRRRSFLSLSLLLSCGYSPSACVSLSTHVTGLRRQSFQAGPIRGWLSTNSSFNLHTNSVNWGGTGFPARWGKGCL